MKYDRVPELPSVQVFLVTIVVHHSVQRFSFVSCDSHDRPLEPAIAETSPHMCPYPEVHRSVACDSDVFQIGWYT